MKFISMFALTTIMVFTGQLVNAESKQFSQRNYEVALDGKTVELTELLDSVAKTHKKKFLLHSSSRKQVVAYAVEDKRISYQELLLILELNRMAAVEINGYINIIPVSHVKQLPIPSITGDQKIENNSLWVTKIIHAGSLNVGELLPILRSLVPTHGHMAAHRESSSLVVVAPYNSVKRIEGLIQELNRATNTN